MKNQYSYTSGVNLFKGAFNIYQAKNGSIILLLNTKITILSKSQINDLSIDCHSLTDFDGDLFNTYYDTAYILSDNEIEDHYPYARSLTDYGAQIGAKWARDQYKIRIT